MIAQILIGCVLMIVTTFIHSGCTLMAIRVLRSDRARHIEARSRLARAWLVAALVLLMFLASLIEVTIWSLTYIAQGAIAGFETALYFSMVTFTTLGYGEIVLGEDWRLLASFEAANGIIMFGWTTALIIAFLQYAISQEESIEEEKGS